MRRQTLASILVSLVVWAGVAHAETYEIEGLDRLRFSVEHITADPGEEVTIKLVNETKLPASAMSHNWVLLGLEADPRAFNAAAVSAKDNEYIPPDRQEAVIAHTDLVAGGEAAEVTFTAPTESGDYPYICTFPGHFAAGMTGTLTVSEQ